MTIKPLKPLKLAIVYCNLNDSAIYRKLETGHYDVETKIWNLKYYRVLDNE